MHVNDMLDNDLQERVRAMLDLSPVEEIPVDVARVIHAKGVFQRRVGRSNGMTTDQLALVLAQVVGLPDDDTDDLVTEKRGPGRPRKKELING